MSALTIDFPFDELPVKVCDVYDMSLLAYGTAELTASGDDPEDGFYVSEIKLDSGALLKRPSKINSSGGFEGELFSRIADVIENPKSKIGQHAEEAFAEAWEEARQPDPDDARDRRRDDAAYFAHTFA